MPGEAIISIQNAVHSFGAQTILGDVSLTVHEGDRIGLIGRNGTGKSTLMKIMAGELEPDGGLITRRQRLRVSYLSQQSDLDEAVTVGAALAEAAEDVRHLLEEHDRVAAELAKADPNSANHEALAADYDALHHELELSDAWHLDEQIKRISVALNLPPGDRVLGSLSGGELRRVHIAATVIRRPDVLLLDEPTNHIDIQSVEWIENFLAGYAGSCVVVTHDRYFLDRVATRIAELENGGLIAYPGNYPRFLELKAARTEQEARSENNRQQFLRRELEWIRRAPKARATKQKARIGRFDEWAEQTGPQQRSNVEFIIPQPPRLGKRILEADDLSKAYGDHVLFRDFSIILQKNMRVGIIGPNGSGKTTLLRVLMGEAKADSGQLFTGSKTEFVYVSQDHGDVNPEDTVLDYVSEGRREIEVNGQRLFIPAFLEKFLFDQSVTQMKMKYLSGGERNRLDLCRKFMIGGNILVLDEPTNDLDLPTLRVLEEAIGAFDGCTFIVSHDRYFLNRLCTHLIVFEEGGKVTIITGNYDDYQTYRKRKDKEIGQASQAQRRQSRPEPARQENPRRLSYTEQRELKDMDERILEAEQAVEELEQKVLVEGFYEQEYALVQDTLAQLEQAKSCVETMYERWQALEAMAQQ